ncbi:MAG: flagellar basal body P-ring formation chaperone FlgA [Colwellia sp.]
MVAATELDSAYIQDFAKQYLIEKFPSTEEEKIQVSVSEIDPRITIHPCTVPLIAYIPDKNSTRNVSIKISCDDQAPWKIYLSAKVEITEAVLVAKNTISRGDTLDESNIELVYMPIYSIRGEKLTDTSIIFGAKAERRIAQGKAISKNSICLVCKGDVVTITASSKSFNIKTRGVALSSGNFNEQIRVKNSHSNRIIIARVKTMNQVIIHL